MPTYVWITIIVTVISVLGLHLYVQRRYHYICPICSKEFKPTYLRSLIAVNAVNYRKVRCPHCNYHDYMEVLKDKREN